MKFKFFPIDIMKISAFFYKKFKTVILITSFTTILFFCLSFMVPKKKEVKFILLPVHDHQINLRVRAPNSYSYTSFVLSESTAVYERFIRSLSSEKFNFFLQDLKRNKKYENYNLDIFFSKRDTPQKAELVFHTRSKNSFSEIEYILDLYFQNELSLLNQMILDQLVYTYDTYNFNNLLQKEKSCKEYLSNFFTHDYNDSYLKECKMNSLVLENYQRDLQLLNLYQKNRKTLIFDPQKIINSFVIQKKIVNNANIILTIFGFVVGIILSIVILQKKFFEKIK
jgi:hypothetical protein